jgi:hypothetical protein
MLYQLSYLGAAGAGELRGSGGYKGTALPLSSGCWGKRRKERRWNDDGGWKRALGFTVPGIGTRTALKGRSACLANDRQGLNAGSISIAAGISGVMARPREPAPKGVCKSRFAREWPSVSVGRQSDTTLPNALREEIGLTARSMGRLKANMGKVMSHAHAPRHRSSRRNRRSV